MLRNLLFFGLASFVGLMGLIGACDGGDSTATTIGFTGGGGEINTDCPTDTCPGGCQAPLTCCNGVCVDLDNDIKNCGQCCHGCPNPHPVCNAGSCEQAQCNQMPNPCMNGQFCCDTMCCPNFNDLCCPNGDGTFSCAPTGATNCP